MSAPLTPEELRAALEREGLRLRPGEEADVLETARYLREALRLIRDASPC